MADEYAVHDVMMSDQPAFGPSGQVGTQTVCQFWVGTHGPFRLSYPKQEATADRINHDINQQVALLRSVSGTGASGG
jgi:hypothetical protein